MNKKTLFLANTFSNVGFSLISQLIGFFIIPLFVKELGKELYGIWALSITIMGYFGFMDLGMSGGLVKYISEEKAISDFENIRKTISSSFVFYCIIGIIIFLGINIYVNELVGYFNISAENKQTAINILRISTVIALFNWPSMTFSSTLEGLQKYVPKNTLLGISSIVNAALVLLFVYLDFSLEKIIIFSSLSRFIPWVGNYVIVKRSLPSNFLSVTYFSLKKVKEMFSFNVWVLIQQLVSMIIYKTDQIVIGLYLPVASITTYVVITKLYFVVHRFSGTLFGAIWPTIFSAKKLNDNNLIKSMVKKGTIYITVLIVPISALGLIISKIFIELWMGKEYSVYSIWTELLFITWFFGPLFGVLGNVLIGIGKIKIINAFGILGALINLGLSILLTQKIGFAGVLLGTIITNSVFMLMEFPIFMKLLDTDWKEIFFPISKIISFCFVAALLGFIVLSYLPHIHFIGIIIFSGIFLLLQYIFLYRFFIEENDKALIDSTLIKLGLKRT